MPAKEYQDASVALQQRLNQLCNRFEYACRHAAEQDWPCIEAFLQDVDPVFRIDGLQELVLLDVFYRRQKGERCMAAEYQSRFPELALVWLAEHIEPDEPSATDMRVANHVG